MLILFTIKNYRSFRDEVTLSMVPGRERRFDWTLPTFSSGSPKTLLPLAAIYGANASGKSNLLDGLRCLRDFIRKGANPGEKIDVVPYRLDPEWEKKPTEFCIALRMEEKIYQYTLHATKNEVFFEELTQIQPNGKETFLFRRKKGSPFEINKKALNLSKDDEQRARFVYEGTQDNLSFITSGYRQKIDFVKPIFEWFTFQVIIIFPETGYAGKEIFDNGDHIQREVSRLLSQYDTGVVDLQSKTLELDHIPADLKDIINIREENDFVLPTGPYGQRIRITTENETCKYSVLNAVHKNVEGENISFSFGDESDGTNRLIDLLPAIVECRDHPTADKLFVIDEIDRSIHPNLVTQIIQDFLLTCSYDARSQLIMTTHNTGLMRQSLLRRDEMWIVDKRNDQSSLYSVSEFKDIRSDTIIEKIYKEGRLGGVPRIIASELPEKKSFPDEKEFRSKKSNS